MEDVRERANKGKVVGKWERERREYYKEKEWEIEKIEKLREGGELREGDNKEGEKIVRERKMKKNRGV